MIVPQTHSHFKWLPVILVLGKDRDRMWFFYVIKKGIGDRHQQKTGHRLLFFSAVTAWGTSHLHGRPYLCPPLFTHFYPTQWCCLSAFCSTCCDCSEDCGDNKHSASLFSPQVSFRYHCRLYSEWRRANQQVILLVPKSANVLSNQQSLLGLKSLKRNSKETIVWFGQFYTGTKIIFPQTRWSQTPSRSQERAVLIYWLFAEEWIVVGIQVMDAAVVWYLLRCQTCLFSRYCMEFYKLMIILASCSDANFFIVWNIKLW